MSPLLAIIYYTHTLSVSLSLVEIVSSYVYDSITRSDYTTTPPIGLTRSSNSSSSMAASSSSTAAAATATAAATVSSRDEAALWLHNKLVSATHLWSFSSTVVSQYTSDKLHAIKERFATLDSIVKFKFFLSLLYIPKRNLDEFKPIVQEIIDMTVQTCMDQWVLHMALFVQTYWSSQVLDTSSAGLDYATHLESFRDAYVDLKRICMC